MFREYFRNAHAGDFDVNTPNPESQRDLAGVPDSRRAKAVRACLEEEINPMALASILRRHENMTVYLDKNSAALLTRAALSFV
jgi:hypothetical protein